MGSLDRGGMATQSVPFEAVPTPPLIQPKEEVADSIEQPFILTPPAENPNDPHGRREQVEKAAVKVVQLELHYMRLYFGLTHLSRRQIEAIVGRVEVDQLFIKKVKTFAFHKGLKLPMLWADYLDFVRGRKLTYLEAHNRVLEATADAEKLQQLIDAFEKVPAEDEPDGPAILARMVAKRDRPSHIEPEDLAFEDGDVRRDTEEVSATDTDPEAGGSQAEESRLPKAEPFIDFDALLDQLDWDHVRLF